MSDILLTRKRGTELLLKPLSIHFLFTYCLIEFIRHLIAYLLPPCLWSFYAAAKKSPGEERAHHMNARAIAVATAAMPGTLGIVAATRAHTAAPLASGNALFTVSGCAAVQGR